jgi:hypothetical protein
MRCSVAHLSARVPLVLLLPAILLASASPGPGIPAAPSALASGPADTVPSPASYLGYAVGTDRKLADWGEVTGYLAELSRASDRVRMDTLGPTTLGRPYVLLTISSPENLARLRELRDVQAKLADPRRISGPGERERLLETGRVVVLITAAIHSTEVGAAQVPMRIAYRLASSDDPEIQRILDQCIVLLVPSLNPDGVDLVTHWYRSTVGMPWEGANPPFLYHHYVGHDDNRDWYAFTQQETRLAVARIHNVWHPQIVHDIHQQGRFGSRFFLPPWMDPVEPNVDPALVAGINDLGTSMAWALERQGKKGVVVDATYDAWTPGRAYQHYHAGVRILSETAGADLASPVDIPFDKLEPGLNFDPRRRSWNFPDPWPGGEWRLSDIVSYMEAGAFALLDHAAMHRRAWLESFLGIGQRAVAKWARWPEAWVIPAGQARDDGLAELLRILLTADVEVGRARTAFAASGRSFPAGSYVIDMHQPYASFAEAMLERQRYPDLRACDDCPLRRPYDVTAWTLPLLLGVDAYRAERPVRVATEPVSAAPEVAKVAPGLTSSAAVKVGLYQPWVPSMDEGWTRWIFDQYHIPYDTLHNADVKQGDLARRFTTILLASIRPGILENGFTPGSEPARYVGGLGDEGAAELRAFVEEGGTLVALERSTPWVIEKLRLPLRDVIAGLEPTEYYAPGSIVRLELVDRPRDGEDGGRGGGRGRFGSSMPDTATIAWLGRGGAAFELSTDAAADAGDVRVVARYGAKPTLLSGWLQGADHVAEKAALVEVRIGRGRVLLFGFRPQYRGESVATFPLLFDALRPPR